MRRLFDCSEIIELMQSELEKLLFGEKYDELFNSSTKADEILYSFRLLKLVQKLNNQTDSKKYTFLSDATLHTMALMHKECPDLEIDSDHAGDVYKKVLKALATLIKERRKEEGDKYEHRRTFKDPETYGRAVEILKEV